jgi:uncharacterized RDD family membrane protein YckC
LTEDLEESPVEVSRVNETSLRPAGLTRRLAAGLLDHLLLDLIIYFKTGEILREVNEDSGFLFAVMIIFHLFYYPVLEGFYKHATVGKWIMRIKVVDESGQGVSIGRSFVRYTVTWVVGFITFGLGILYAGIQKDKRGLHDIWSKTNVVLR